MSDSVSTSSSVVGGVPLGGLELVDLGLAEKTGGDLALKEDIELSVGPASGLGETEEDCKRAREEVSSGEFFCGITKLLARDSPQIVPRIPVPNQT